MVEAFLRALLAGDRGATIDLARRALVEHGLTYVCEELVTPSLEQVGALYEQNRLSMADEHVATAAALATIAALYPFVRWPPRGPKAVVAAVEGDQHMLGSRIVSDLLALDGWDDVYLGCDMPAGALAAKAREESAVLVALSATLPARLPALRAAVHAVRKEAPQAKILVGGRGICDAREVFELDVDMIARSASGGVDAARRFKT